MNSICNIDFFFTNRKSILLAILSLLLFFDAAAQNATIKEETANLKTYGFSDPNPIPSLAYRPRIYPYFRFDGYSHTAKDQSWKVVTLENDYLKVTVFPEIGGKVWGAFEKSTGEDFIYNNEVVKFRNIAMRGPWTSGGIEFNFGIIGHTPATATPVDYVLIENEDGSVSCIVGAMDLPSRTQWRVKINLPHDKAYFTTQGLWYNPTPIHNSYYNWMTAAARASDDLEFFYPGEHALQHSGESKSWPFNPSGTNEAWYKNNATGGHRSHHMAGSFNNFFGGYFHEKNIGFGHWAPYDEMPGKKLWLWALSRAGGIWEDLLTDHNGQYIEFQAGRMLNQFQSSASKPTPLTEVGFAPYSLDQWTDYWFPVKNTGGISSATALGSIYVEKNKNGIAFKFNALQKISDEIQVKSGGNVIYRSMLNMNPMDVFSHAVKNTSGEEKLEIYIGNERVFYSDKEDPYKLRRPFVKQKTFAYSPADKLYNEGRQSFITRNYQRAREKFEACLELDPGHQKARIGYSELLYRNTLYKDALENIFLALENDYYDFNANFIAGITFRALNKPFDAMEALGWAARSMEYRSAAYAMISEIHLESGNLNESVRYARQSLDFNVYNINALSVLAVAYRKMGTNSAARVIIDKILDIDPLNHFARFERHLNSGSKESLREFSSLIQNEFPYQSYLELAIDYLRLGQQGEAIKVLANSPIHPLVDLWLSYLTKSDMSVSDRHFADALKKSPEMVFPFREETLSVLEWANKKSNDWKLKYYLGLNLWAKNRNDEAIKLFTSLGKEPDYAPFYLVRTSLLDGEKNYDRRDDIEKALSLDNNQWRTWHMLHQYLDENKLYNEQLSVTTKAYKKFRNNYIIGMNYAEALLNNKRHDQCMKVLNQLNVLPYEGAGEGRNIHEQVYLYSALDDIQKGHYSRAKNKIIRSLEWPENLGVGKPFEFDQRRQDYLMAYLYFKTNQKEHSEKQLQQIVQYSQSNNDGRSLNELLGLKALKKQGKTNEVDQIVDLLQDSKGSFSRWVIHYWKNDQQKMAEVEREIGENKDFILFTEIIKRTADF
jgi:predicted Zn-dependent protease